VDSFASVCYAGGMRPEFVDFLGRIAAALEVIPIRSAVGWIGLVGGICVLGVIARALVTRRRRPRRFRLKRWSL
jgi:hypothetical protein